MTITQTVKIPASRRITIDVPREVPAGEVILTFTPKLAVQEQKKDRMPGCVKEQDKPLSINGKEKPTPRADALLGILSHIGDISHDEIRAERLAKYLT